MTILFGPRIHRKYDGFHLRRREWDFIFHAFGLKYQEICDIFDIYLDLDVDGTGGVDVTEFMDYFGVDGSRQFGARLFTMVDIDGSGEVDFLEFLIVLWLFCTLTAETMGDFLFELYDQDGSGEIELDELSSMMADMMGKSEEGRSKAETRRIAAHVTAEVEKMLELVQEESGHVLRGNHLDRDSFIELIDIHFDLLSPVYEFQRALREKACGLRFWRSKITHRNKDEKVRDDFIPWHLKGTYTPAKAVGVRRGMRVSERIMKIRPWLENLKRLEEKESERKRRYLAGEITNSGKKIRQATTVTVEYKLGRPPGVEFDERNLMVLRLQKPNKKRLETDDPALTAAWEAGVRRGMMIIKVGRGESAEEREIRLKKEARAAAKKAAEDSVAFRTKDELEEKKLKEEEKAAMESQKKTIIVGRSVTNEQSVDDAIEFYRERGELDLAYTFRGFAKQTCSEYILEKLGDCCTYVTDKLFDCLLAPATVDIDEVQEDIYDDQGRIDHIAMALDAKGDAIENRGTMGFSDLSEAEKIAVLQYTEDPRLKEVGMGANLASELGFGASGPPVGLEAKVDYDLATGEKLSDEALAFRENHLTKKAEY